MENEVPHGGGGEDAGEGKEIGEIVDLFMGCIGEFWLRRSREVTEEGVVELGCIEKSKHRRGYTLERWSCY